MTENMYETNQFTNHTNGTYLLGTPHYGAPNINSIQSSPMSPHHNHNHEQLASPVTPGNELSPVLDMPDSAVTWDYNQFGRPGPSSWGSCSQDELSETSGSSRIYPYNSTFTSKYNDNAQYPQRLDSFSKAFPTKNLYLFFGDSNRTDENNSENNHISGVLQLPQSETLSDGMDRQPLESPIFNPMAIQAQTQSICDQSGFHPPDSPMHGLYQNHQQFNYAYQQHKPKATNLEEVNRGLHKPQSPWHHQHGYQVHQSQLMSYPMALHQQEQLHLQHRGTFACKTHLNSQEGHDSSQSPTYGHNQDYKTPEQQTLQGSHSLNLISPDYQDLQHSCVISHENGPYQHQQPQELVQSISLKQRSMFDDGLLASFDKHSSAPNTPVYSSPQEDGQSGLKFPSRNEDLCSPHYQSKHSGGSKGVPLTTIRGDIFTHLTLHTPHWPQTTSPDIHAEGISPHYRAETVLMSGERSRTKMTCTVCQREFKSLPALNGHMRSHRGCRTHQSSPKMQRNGQIHLSSEVSQINPIILPVSVPVKDCLVNSKLTLSPQRHQKDDPNALSKPCAQPPLASVQNQPSCIKRSVLDRKCVPKQEKKRYHHCLVPLMIPPLSGGQESRGAVLFRSQLRSASSMGDDVPYTPPPMLSPIRPGSGLFTAVNGRGNIGRAVSAINAHHSPASDMDGCAVTSADKNIHVTPRINIGKEFQANIPEMRSQSITEKDTHNAVLLWMPTEDLENTDHQRKVDNLLKMACSSVLPGGGINTEYVLHCLFECRGDIMNTLERLLLPTLWKNRSSVKTDYHYAGSDKWTLQEKRQLNKARLIHHKDFNLVQKMVKTKSVSQCVEYYYTCKKSLRLGSRGNTTITTPVQKRQGDWLISNTAQPDKVAKCQTRNSEISDNSNTLFISEVSNAMNGETWNQNNLGLLCSSPAEHRTSTLTQASGSGSARSAPSNSTTTGDTDSALIFACTECGKVFLKAKSRNAHMKTHRQQEDKKLMQFPRVPQQDTNKATYKPSFFTL
ncbi:transcriptional-regulating factor 1-like isoform X2 [Xyrauchen texanus]|uniref:transcriptional-regulating factor 1-like isoform X1 n=1 Tax=Xyrauchen texanus TaxID=154827 RepID=UPI0022421512|nr:transcriptional-regulating factor 1-like isoform X1 [Xyrauchen texanus]XP_052010289.1 transcriptional-regulating factor 1-like isoform X2 [Xyrauchen texanus]